jgi:hypothetical protein
MILRVNALSVLYLLKLLEKTVLILFPKSQINSIMTRPICKVCNRNPCAANYYRNGVRHYRSKCEDCIRKKKEVKVKEPRWKKAGYSKKPTCDLCGFRKIHNSQMTVFHIDGNLNNNDYFNLRTVCLNCIEILKRRDTTWKQGDLEVD